MQCANPDCREPAADLSTGVLRLVELDVTPEERVIRSDGGFPVCSVPSRYFWLCPKCASYLQLRRWTPHGIILENVETPEAGQHRYASIRLFNAPIHARLRDRKTA